MAGTRGRLLYRVILSHLLVAVPPAVVLGLIVIDINRRTLETETQNLHLSVAFTLREQIKSDVHGKLALLGEAERILDMDDVPLDRRKVMLRALVADQRLPYLALYGPGGAIDSLVRVGTHGDVDRTTLTPAVRKEIDGRGWAVSDAVFEGGPPRAVVALAWKREGETFGYVGSALELAPFTALATTLSERYLGEGGEVEIVDGSARYLASSAASRVGAVAGEGTPFAGIEGQSREGASALEVGTVNVFQPVGGEERLGAFLSAPELRWIVGASRPERIAFASIHELRQRVLLMSMIAALGAGLIGLLLARHVSEPIRKLIAAVRTSMRSGFQKKVDVKAKAEVGQLADAFNEAVRALDSHRTALRTRTQLRLRLARFLPPTLLHEVLSKELDVKSRGSEALITVIYADVAKAKALATQIPGEHLVSILGEFYAASCGAVERHNGKMDRYSGDAVIGIFSNADGETRATEAMRAALDIIADTESIAGRWQGTITASFGASVGVANGTAVLGSASDDSGEVSVVGTILDDAAALQESAGSGTIVVDRGTRDAVDGVYECRPVRRPGPTVTAQELFLVDPGKTKELTP